MIVATLDNPPHGLMSVTIAHELDALEREVAADDGIGAVVLTGAHPDRFIAHYDVGELLEAAKQSPPLSAGRARAMGGAVRSLARVPGVSATLGRTPVAGMVDLQAGHDTLTRIGQSGAVWIAAINGGALGGGCELSLACDLRILARAGRPSPVQAMFLSTLASPPALRAMTAYTERLERTGEVPGYDAAARQKLIDGTFVDMTAG